MTDPQLDSAADTSADEERRAFLAKIGKGAMVAPAAALLLAATTRKASANPYSPPPQ